MKNLGIVSDLLELMNFLKLRGKGGMDTLKTFYGNEPIDVKSEHGVAAALEAKRIAEKYEKDFLSCDDLVEIMCVGKNNVRELMNSQTFPTIEIGNRKVVSVISFVLWSLENNRNY